MKPEKKTSNKKVRNTKNVILQIIIRTTIILAITFLLLKFPTSSSEIFGTIGIIVMFAVFMFFVYIWLTIMKTFYENKLWKQMVFLTIIGLLVLTGFIFILVNVF